MRPILLEDLAPHYAETLRHWRHAFNSRLSEVYQLGFDDRFVRMWDYYLAYCEAVFQERQVNDVQLLLAGHECRFDALTQVAQLRHSAPPKQTVGDGRAWLGVAHEDARKASSPAGEQAHANIRPFQHDASMR
jgi:hypothetical protein